MRQNTPSDAPPFRRPTIYGSIASCSLPNTPGLQLPSNILRWARTHGWSSPDFGPWNRAMDSVNRAVRQFDPTSAVRHAATALRYANLHLGKTSGLALQSQSYLAQCLLAIGDPEHTRYALRHLRRIRTIASAGAIVGSDRETADIVRDAFFLEGNTALALGLASRAESAWGAALRYEPTFLPKEPQRRKLAWWARIDAVVGGAAPNISQVAIQEISRITDKLHTSGLSSSQELFSLHLRFIDRAIARQSWQSAVDTADSVLTRFHAGLARSPAARLSVLERWLRAANGAERGEPGRAIGSFSARLERADDALALCAELPLSTLTMRARLEALYTLASTGFGFRAQLLLPDIEEMLGRNPGLKLNRDIHDLLRQVRHEIDPRASDDEEGIRFPTTGFGEPWEEHPSMRVVGGAPRRTIFGLYARLLACVGEADSTAAWRKILLVSRSFTDYPDRLKDLPITDQDHVLEIALDAARGNRDQIAAKRIELLRQGILTERMTRELQLQWLPEQLRMVAEQLFPSAAPGRMDAA